MFGITRRTLVASAVGIMLVGCGSSQQAAVHRRRSEPTTTTTASTTSTPAPPSTTSTSASTTTSPRPVAPRPVLTATGLGPGLEFGTGPEQVINTLTARFGPPTKDTGVGSPCSEGEFGQHREVTWGGLTALFDNERDITQINGTPVPKPGVSGLYFWGWRHYTFDLSGGGPLSGPPRLATSSGVGLGTPLAQAQRALGPFTPYKMDDTDPRPASSADVAGMYLYFDTEQPGSPLAGISAGRGCGE